MTGELAAASAHARRTDASRHLSSSDRLRSAGRNRSRPSASSLACALSSSSKSDVWIAMTGAVAQTNSPTCNPWQLSTPVNTTPANSGWHARKQSRMVIGSLIRSWRVGRSHRSSSKSRSPAAKANPASTRRPPTLSDGGTLSEDAATQPAYGARRTTGSSCSTPSGSRSVSLVPPAPRCMCAADRPRSRGSGRADRRTWEPSTPDTAARA